MDELALAYAVLGLAGEVAKAQRVNQIFAYTDDGKGSPGVILLRHVKKVDIKNDQVHIHLYDDLREYTITLTGTQGQEFVSWCLQREWPI